MPLVPDIVTQQKAAQYVSEFTTQADNANEEQDELFVKLDQLYALRDEQKDIEPWLSDLQITGAFEFVERPFSAMVANTPSFEVVETSKDAPKIKLEQAVVDDPALGGDGSDIRGPVVIPFSEVYESDLGTMWKVKNMKQLLRRFTKGGLIFGTYIAEIRAAVTELKEVEDLLEEDGDVEKATALVEKIVPEVSLVDPFDTVVSPFANDPQDAFENYGGFGVIRNNVILRDLDSDTYFNLDKVENLINPSEARTATEGDKNQKQRTISSTTETQTAPGAVEVIELWCYFSEDDDPKKLKPMILSIANRSELIRFEKLEEAAEVPFVVFKDQEVPGQFWAKGEIEPIIADLYEENTIKNQRIDYVNRVLNEEWLLRSDAGIDPRQLVSSPHNIIVGDDIGDASIRQVQRSTAPLGVSGEDIDRLRRNMAATNGSIDVIATGNEGQVTNTATGELIRERQSTARYLAKIENLEFAVASIAKKMLQIKIDALDDREMVPVFVRGKWREVPSKLYKKYIDKYEIRVRAGSMNIKNAVTERNDSIAVLNILRQAGGDGLSPELQEAYRGLLASFPNVDIDKLLPVGIPQTDETVISSQINNIPSFEEPAVGQGPQAPQGVPGLTNAPQLESIT